MECRTSSGFGTGLLIGAIIGRAIALLYAPQSGERTRQLIKDKSANLADEVREEALNVMDGVKVKASEVVGEAKAKASGVVDKVKEVKSRSGRDDSAAAEAENS